MKNSMDLRLITACALNKLSSELAKKFNDNHDPETGEFSEGGGSGGAGTHGEFEKLRPSWEKAASKMSTPKLKASLQKSEGRANGHPDHLHPMAREVMKKELQKRGVIIKEAA